MNLRDEITNHIKILTPNPTDSYIDEILSMIEKRIDSEINKLQESKVLNPCRYDNVLTLNTLKAMLK